MITYKVIQVTEETDEEYVYTRHSGEVGYGDALDLGRYYTQKQGKFYAGYDYTIDLTNGNYDRLEKFIRDNKLQVGDAFVVKVESEHMTAEELMRKFIKLCENV